MNGNRADLPCFKHTNETAVSDLRADCEHRQQRDPGSGDGDISQRDPVIGEIARDDGMRSVWPSLLSIHTLPHRRPEK